MALDYPLTPLLIAHVNDAYKILDGQRSQESEVPRPLAVQCYTCSDYAPVKVKEGDASIPECTLLKGQACLGGAARFQTAVKAVHASAAALGGHSLLLHSDELDFGEQRCAKLAGECAFPWLQSNLKKIVGGGTLPGTAESALLTCGPWRVGVIGLIAADWLEASSCAYLCRHYTLEEPLQAALRLSQHLRAQGAHLVLALTHMHLSEDKALALALTAAAATAGAPVIDLLLGGHDHEVAHSVQPGAVPLLKSGADFTLCSVVQVWGAGGAEGSSAPPLPSPHQHLPAHLPPGAFLQPLPAGPPLPLLASSGRALLQAALLPITAAVPPDSAVAALVAAEYSKLGEASPVLAQVLGMSSVPLNLMEADTRTMETNAGNLLADLMRASVDADCALLNSGSLRSNRVLGPGFLRYGDMVSLLPKYTDIVVKLQVKGRDLLQALNHSVGSLPSPSGKFLQVSGLRFSYDTSRPPGQRVQLGSVQILKRRPKAAGASPAAPSPASSQGGAGAMASSSSSGGATSGGGSCTPGEHFGGQAEDAPCAADGSLREAAFVGCVHKLGHFRLREVTLDSKAAEQALLWELLSARPLHNPLVGRTPEESRAHYEVEDWELAEYAHSLRGLYGPASELLGGAGSSKHAHGTPLHAAAAWMSAGGLEESQVERWEPLVEEESYTLATKDYLISGGDGYKWLDETSPENWDHHVHNIVTKETGHTLTGLLVAYLHILAQESAHRLHRHGATEPHPQQHFMTLAPEVEGRIVDATPVAAASASSGGAGQ